MTYLVYKTDAWHSYASRDIIGVATDKIIAIDICKQQAKKESERIANDQLFNLDTILQTQGYSGPGEFQIEKIETNTLL